MGLAQAEIIVQSKDWLAEKNVMTPLDKAGCVAQTTKEIDVNGIKENWTLQVIKLQANNGEYAHPIIISFPEQLGAAQYYEGTGQTNKVGTPTFEMTLLQPNATDKTIVAARMKDRLEIVRRLRADSTFSVSYLDKTGPVQTAEFSLRGSSKVIKALNETCR